MLFNNIAKYGKLLHMEDLLTTKQLMELLQIDRTTIYRMLNDGRLPALRVGGQWRFSRQTIDAWFKERNTATLAVPKLLALPVSPSLDSEILPMSCLQPIQEVFAQTSDVGALTTDLDGKPIVPISNSCAFCDLVRSTEQGRSKCEASWRKLVHQTERRPHLERCHAGLTYARGRVVVQNNFVAMFFVGQFLVDGQKSFTTPTHLARVARACEVDEIRLAKAATQIQVVSDARAKRLLHLIQLMADTYSQLGEERLVLTNRLKQVAEIAAPK
jgi:excisionase family DNA binding protein